MLFYAILHILPYSKIHYIQSLKDDLRCLELQKAHSI